VDLGGAERTNTRQVGGGLTLADGPGGTPTRLAGPSVPGAAAAEGSYLAPEITTDRWVSAVTVRTTANRPTGSDVTVDVRGRDVQGAWTQWREVPSGRPVALPAPVSQLQARVVLHASPSGAAPVVSGVDLSSVAAPAESAALAAAAPVTYRLFATREGLVGHTTANGHVIKQRDHFVALPSRRMLASKGGNEYRVKVCNGSKCETAPVWDVGPWNTKDDYWNPANVRERFADLPQGKPEAQAAYQNGYNGGKDGSGRKVANPAGIDIADGMFWDGLGMTNNGWVDVTFNPGSGGGGEQVTAWGRANVRSCPRVSCDVVSYVVANETYPATCWTVGDKVTAEGITNDKWVKLPLAAGGTGFVSAIYLKGDETGGVKARC
jgi:hypothetical protein